MTTTLSKTFKGKQAVIDELLVPFREALVDGHIHIHVENLLADGDFVVVQGRGEAMTKRGVAYDNTYCWVYRFEGGKIKALTELVRFIRPRITAGDGATNLVCTLLVRGTLR